MTHFSRRDFLVTAGAAAIGAVGLKGCASSSTSTSQSPATQASPVANVNPGSAPEVTTAKLGFIPIFESAPLIIAKEKGLFAKYGMPDIEVVKQSSWGAMRDNTEIGSAGGGVDGGQYQMPIPHLISEGKITKGNQKIPMYVLAQLVTHANGIAIANKHQGKGLGLDVSGAKSYIQQLNSSGTPFTAAHTFPQCNQELWIRYWMAAGGIDPDKDMKLLVVPASQTVANMKAGTMDGFSTGDPWPYRILADKIGFMSALTAQIWKYHPEEYLAMRADWVDKHPKATKAILMAVMEAQQWCDDFKNRAELADIVGGRNYFNIPTNILTPPFAGKYAMGDGKPDIDDQQMGPLYWKDGLGSVSYPYKSHDLWFLTENIRWGFLPGDTDTKKIVDAVNREDIWKEAAKEMGVAAADIPTNTSRGVEKFFDGTTFDPANPKAYLDSLKIKAIKA